MGTGVIDNFGGDLGSVEQRQAIEETNKDTCTKNNHPAAIAIEEKITMDKKDERKR